HRDPEEHGRARSKQQLRPVWSGHGVRKCRPFQRCDRRISRADRRERGLCGGVLSRRPGARKVRQHRRSARIIREGDRGYGAHRRWAHTQRVAGRARSAAVMKAVVPLLAIMTITEILAAVPDQAELQKMAARFAPVELRADTSKLSPGDRKALAK